MRFMRSRIPNAFCVIFVLLCCWPLACFLCVLAGLLLVFCFFFVGSLVFGVFLQLEVASNNTQNIFIQSMTTSSTISVHRMFCVFVNAHMSSRSRFSKRVFERCVRMLLK